MFFKSRILTKELSHSLFWGDYIRLLGQTVGLCDIWYPFVLNSSIPLMSWCLYVQSVLFVSQVNFCRIGFVIVLRCMHDSWEDSGNV